MTLRMFLSAPLLDASFPLPVDEPFHRQTAIRAGVPRSWLTALLRSGHLRRPLAGVYVAAQVPDDMNSRLACLRLVVPDDGVVCDRHAAWVHGADMVLAPDEDMSALPLRVFRRSGVDRLRGSGIDSGQRAFLSDDVTEINGLAVTTPLRTALDLGRVRSRVAAMSGVDAMMRAGVDRERFRAEIERFKHERYVTVLREVAALADARSASPGESACKLAYYDVAGTLPDLQIEVSGPGGTHAYLDLGCRALKFAVEYDGEAWHSSPEQIEHDITRRRFIAENDGYDIAVARRANVYGDGRDIEAIIRMGIESARRRLRAAG